MCNQEDDQEIKIDFYRSATSGDHKHLGTIYTDLNELKNQKKQFSFGKNEIEVVSFELKRATNFLEYVFGGCNINLSIAVDFTLSNGDPNHPGSLHSKDFNRNEYMQALKGVGDIL